MRICISSGHGHPLPGRSPFKTCRLCSYSRQAAVRSHLREVSHAQSLNRSPRIRRRVRRARHTGDESHRRLAVLQHTETATPLGHVACVSTATLHLSQEGSTLTPTFDIGTQECGGRSSQYLGNMPPGQLTGSSVNFPSHYCTYTGTTSGDPVDRLAGDLSCHWDDGTSTTGTWEATTTNS